LIASVLEDETTHQTVYRSSQANAQNVVQPESPEHQQHSVQYGIDATRLSDFFAPHSLDRIIFNFPHWRGKSNHRYNRALVKDFLESCVPVLRPETGRVHIALVKGQSGMEANNVEEWRQTWTVPMFANDAGLLLDAIEKFDIQYNLSSHRGKDRPFPTSQMPRRLIFRLPHDRDPINIDDEYQIACRHELRLEVCLESDGKALEERGLRIKDLINGDLILDLMRRNKIVPQGIRAEIATRAAVPVALSNDYRDQGKPGQFLVYLMVYRGESQPLTREIANQIRADLEDMVDQHLKVTLRKRGYTVSRPFPYRLLQTLLEDHTS